MNSDYPELHPAKLMRSECEISITWAEANPALFADTFNSFFDGHPDLQITSKVRRGFLTLIAEPA